MLLFAIMKILSPAKINLFLHVIGKRSDGYHELVTLMCPIGLFDTVSLDFDTKETSVTCSHPGVPQNKKNLAYKAAVSFFNALEKQEHVKINIDKHIPVAAGLGGGSSNAATVLLALNRHFGSPFAQKDLMAMSLSLGADVPFFIYRKPAIATGIGEKLKSYERPLPFRILLVYPGFEVSTAEIYKNLNLGLTKCKNKNNYNGFMKQKFDVANHLCNDLEAVTASMYPDVQVVKEALLRSGANGALMSGSGPTVFGLFCDSDKAREAYDSLSQNKQWQVYLADLIG
jgi:4-diphosphocytidyl-2-C-methyl-D-erythritol kinase